MKKHFKLLLVLTALAALLAGCAADAKTDRLAAEESYAPAGDMLCESARLPSSGGDLADTDQGDLPNSNQKLIKTLRLRAETEDFDTLLPGVENRIAQLGGYVESSEVFHGGAYDENILRSARMTVRIPAEKLSEFVEQLSGISNITSRSESTEDVTLTYSDTESRVKALEVEQGRLLALMEQAETTQDLLEIESRLTEVRYQLESAASRLKLYDNLVSYSTVHLDIQEVRALTPTQEPTVWQRLSAGFMDNLRGLGNFFVNLFVFLISALPIWLPIAAIVIVCVVVHRKHRNRKNSGE